MLQPKSPATESTVDMQYSVCAHVCVWERACMPVFCELVLVSCFPLLSLSISRMISLTWAPQGLVILVISSTCRSIVAASGRPNKAEKKEEPPPCSHHQCMTRSDQKAGNKQVNELCERFAEALKMDEENIFKKWRNLLYIYLHQVCLCELSSDCRWLFFFPRRYPVEETVLPGQINWRDFAHRPHRLMKRPRGYLQGHTKELVEMLNENWALSRMPWVASNYCRPCFQGTITERGLPY